MTAPDGAPCLAEFHAERPGVTETVLGSARDAAGRTPYTWAAERVPERAQVLDLACGSAPVAALLPAGPLSASTDPHGSWQQPPPAVRAAPPLPDCSVDAVVISMALMLVPLSSMLEEVARVLRPGLRAPQEPPAARGGRPGSQTVAKSLQCPYIDVMVFGRQAPDNRSVSRP